MKLDSFPGCTFEDLIKFTYIARYTGSDSGSIGLIESSIVLLLGIPVHRPHKIRQAFKTEQK